MTAYRFCRTDDMALLVAAYEVCRGPEHDAVPPLDLAGFKVLVRELDLWCSSCMVALEGREPVGVLLGAKRATSTLVYGLRVHPEHRRKGHGRHLLTSLGQKLAILGPSRMVAEVPAEDAAANELFAACGWRIENEMRDWRLGLKQPTGRPGDSEGLSRLTVAELRDAGALAESAAWAHDTPALEKRASRLEAIGFHSPERLEAWAVFERSPDRQPWPVLRLGREPGALGSAALALVVEALLREANGSDLLFERATPEDLAPEDLAALGFSPGARHFLFAAEAKAA